MTDDQTKRRARLAQAQDERSRLLEEGTLSALLAPGQWFIAGWQAADANPQPHTITCEQLGEAEELLEVGADLSAVLSHLGIGVQHEVCGGVGELIDQLQMVVEALKGQDLGGGTDG